MTDSAKAEIECAAWGDEMNSGMRCYVHPYLLEKGMTTKISQLTSALPLQLLRAPSPRLPLLAPAYRALQRACSASHRTKPMTDSVPKAQNHCTRRDQ